MLSSLAPCQIGVTGHNVKWIDRRRSHLASFCPTLYGGKYNFRVFNVSIDYLSIGQIMLIYFCFPVTVMVGKGQIISE